MSFSAEVKQELADIYPKARHCMIAEVAGMMTIAGEESDAVSLQSDNKNLQRKFFTLLLKAFNIEKDLFPDVSENSPPHRTVLDDAEKARAVRLALSHPMLLSKECCRRSFLRGAFLAGGSISDPEKYYHFEIVCGNAGAAETVRDVIRSFGVEAKTVTRKNNWVVYLKEGDQIVEVLGDMEAGKSFMRLVNVRIYREFRGKINRQVNCETANLNRIAVTAARQTEDICFIAERLGLSSLPPPLRQMAEARLRFPEASLKELGDMMDPKLGKSGVNHRLRKLSEIAEGLRSRGDHTDDSPEPGGN